MSKFRRTINGLDPTVLISALQKAIRRGDLDLAAFCACELLRSSYGEWAWRRITVTAAEDVAAFVQTEINALRASCELERKQRKGPASRVFINKALIILCQALKSRDADHLGLLVIDKLSLQDERLAQLLADAEIDPVPMPDYVFDCHTTKGKAMGRTKKDFLRSEYAALNPRQPGLFDALVEKLDDDR